MDRPAALYFYNTHPMNPLLARKVRRRFPGTAVVLHLHDPYKPDKRAYGRRGSLRIRTVEFVQKLTVRQADHIVFPSDYSRELFQSRYQRFSGATHVAPLLIPDRPDATVPPRTCFSMVGRMHRATGHDTFRELVNYAGGKGLAYQFALVCSNDLSKYLSQVLPQGRESLTVISRRLIEDAVIDTVMKQSYASLRLAKEVTQSGVVPVAYMNRTPVIARDIPGLRQHVRHEHNGYLVPGDCGPVHLVAALEYVKANFARLSANARRSYEETWSERNWDTHYGWLMQLLEGHATAYSKS
jgi:glycosyltransferase involved in cell wall biosynthesis